MPVALELRAPASLLVWPFLAVVPVLLGSSLGRDEEEPSRAGGAGRGRPAPPGAGLSRPLIDRAGDPAVGRRRQRPMGAVSAPVVRDEGLGASSTCSPRRPAET